MIEVVLSFAPGSDRQRTTRELEELLDHEERDLARLAAIGAGPLPLERFAIEGIPGSAVRRC